jgi:hypothetical protein
MSNIVAILLTFEALRYLTPIDNWAAIACSKDSGFCPNAGLTDRAARRFPLRIQGLPIGFAFRRHLQSNLSCPLPVSPRCMKML